MTPPTQGSDARARLSEIEAELQTLRAENARLRDLLGLDERASRPAPAPAPAKPTLFDTGNAAISKQDRLAKNDHAGGGARTDPGRCVRNHANLEATLNPLGVPRRRSIGQGGALGRMRWQTGVDLSLSSGQRQDVGIHSTGPAAGQGKGSDRDHQTAGLTRFSGDLSSL